MPSLLFTLFLGLILGIKHAFEADHVIAVSTIASEQKNPFKTILIGILWGVGHTATLLVVGIFVLLLKITIPQSLNILLEGVVGVMLIVLGIKVFKNDSSNHFPNYKIPILVGFVHGVAGSGVITLLVLATMQSVLEGLYYILIFGIGSILGMTIMSFIIGLPFLYSKKKLPQLENSLRRGAAILSIIFGLFVIYKVILGLF